MTDNKDVVNDVENAEDDGQSGLDPTKMDEFYQEVDEMIAKQSHLCVAMHETHPDVIAALKIPKYATWKDRIFLYVSTEEGKKKHFDEVVTPMLEQIKDSINDNRCPVINIRQTPEYILYAIRREFPITWIHYGSLYVGTEEMYKGWLETEEQKRTHTVLFNTFVKQKKTDPAGGKYSLDDFFDNIYKQSPVSANDLFGLNKYKND